MTASQLTKGRAFVASLPLKTRFYDAHDRRAYARAIEVAVRIVDSPELLADGTRFIDRHMRPDPHQQKAATIWRSLLAQEVKSVVRAFLEDSDHGQFLRDTAPVFVVLPRPR